MAKEEKGEHGTKIRTKCANPLRKDLNTLDFSKKRNKIFYAIIAVLGLIAVGFGFIVGLVELWKIL